jgi:hypothetical protein
VRLDDETIARELGLISGVSNPVLSTDKLAGVDAVFFTPGAVNQGLSEIALTRLHGLIVDSHALFEILQEQFQGKYHLLGVSNPYYRI